MGINKVNYGNTTLIDISGDTVTAGSMLSGTTAHDNSGAAITGTIASKSSSDLTASGATVTVPAGHYASQATKSVATGTAGTPTATKGAVSNHAISVTPSVTNTAGYISGGTKTGTAVSVSASELVSGNKAITENGTGIDVANYATVDVAVSGAKFETLTATGETSTSSNRHTRITFTGLKGEPLMFFLQLSSYGNSTNIFASALYDGDTLTFTRNASSAIYGSGSSSSSNLTFTYSNGSLTLTNPEYPSPQYRFGTYTYTLTYAY